jgi:hypothetical protein
MDSAFALRFAPAPWNDRLDRSGSGMTVSVLVFGVRRETGKE